ncbi:MAG: glycine--tRNA ligase subunit beta [Rhodocyclaceae bacterium]|nr:glycine--tRNA ligase subunit beta [Rhodocyclaceae bacterium]MBX3669025.1 glycine--tRNA ligase subunit beta [Rhodocyclaceae bacterium]
MQDTLLIELLTEELPPKALARLGESFADSVARGLAERKLAPQPPRCEWFASPRRLAVTVHDVVDAAADEQLTEKIMPVAVALDARGEPTPALMKKLAAKGLGAEVVAQFERRMDGKAESLFLTSRVAGARLADVLSAIVTEAVKKLPIPKVMRWGDSEHEFVRPVHGLVMLHGAELVAGEVLGLSSRRHTRGHRFLGARDIDIASAADYARTLYEQGSVMASFLARRVLVERELAHAAEALGGGVTPIQDAALVDEVTALVEYPVVYVAEFEPQFLAVPQECLILTMKQNQKYFPLLDAAGKLINKFLVVSNMRVDDPTNIVAGNARVVRARLADARFFFDQDRREPLAARVAKLAAVVYHNRLGSQGARVERLVRLAGHIARQLHGDAAAAERAALLAKADLVTDMVGEFPELQGIMGRYYARHDGESDSVAQAVAAHYQPRFAGDALPHDNVARAVALADRLDALAGFFGIGQVPTGDRDPFGLRRAALGVLRILMEAPLPLDLAALVEQAGAGFPAAVLKSGFEAELLDFMRERLRHLLREQGHAQDAVEAVLALAPVRIDLVPAKLEAVRAFAALPQAEALAAANKRIVNILKKSGSAAASGVDVALLQEEAERALFDALNAAAPGIESQLANEDYTGALCALAALRPAVDTFFDKVMVMSEEPLLRGNRLALLARLAALMNGVADISRLGV